jgi:hypothetical protein
MNENEIANRIVEIINSNCGRNYKPTVPGIKDYKELGPIANYNNLIEKRNFRVSLGIRIDGKQKNNRKSYSLDWRRKKFWPYPQHTRITFETPK